MSRISRPPGVGRPLDGSGPHAPRKSTCGQVTRHFSDLRRERASSSPPASRTQTCCIHPKLWDRYRQFFPSSDRRLHRQTSRYRDSIPAPDKYILTVRGTRRCPRSDSEVLGEPPGHTVPQGETPPHRRMSRMASTTRAQPSPGVDLELRDVRAPLAHPSPPDSRTSRRPSNPRHSTYSTTTADLVQDPHVPRWRHAVSSHQSSRTRITWSSPEARPARMV